MTSDFLKFPIKHWTKPEDLKRLNAELCDKVKRGELVGINQQENLLQLFEPNINGLWLITLEGGFIKKITLF